MIDKQIGLASILSIFKIAVGPSSSHTLGCIKIGAEFLEDIKNLVTNDCYLKIELLGSLAYTGEGHLSDIALIAGLTNFNPEKEFIKTITDVYNIICEQKYIILNNFKINFNPKEDLIFNKNDEPKFHPNTIKLKLLKENQVLITEEYLSIGGGEIKKINDKDNKQDNKLNTPITMKNILAFCKHHEISLLEWIIDHEHKEHFHSSKFIYEKLSVIWQIMTDSIENGLISTGVLPGCLALEKRAKLMYAEYLESFREWKILAPEITLTSIYAIAISEQNASGCRIVTAPTCGSAGILPAVLRMLKEKYHYSNKKIYGGLLIAGFIGSLAVKNASISGAEVGCQGEIGVASAMAAAAACYLLGGNNEQIERAAEIALEHHLGLTCDPVAGLVQIPCIERNAVGAVTALNSSNLALLSNKTHRVSFDDCLSVMKQTGIDMSNKYKETALGGLAKIIGCQINLVV